MLREKDEPFSRKEILTMDGIRADLKTKRVDLTSWLMVSGISIALLIMGFIVLCSGGGHLSWILLGPGFLIPLVVLLYQLHLFMQNRRWVAGRLIVVKDTLRFVEHRVYRLFFYRQFIFIDLMHFIRSGTFNLKRRRFYEWSRENRMTSSEILETSHPGDGFYVVISAEDPKKRPLMFYNTKIFEYPDNPDETENDDYASGER